MGIFTRGDHQMHLGRRVLYQKCEGFVNWFGINQVIVVKDEDEIIRDGGDFVDQSDQYCFDGWRLRRLEHRQRSRSNIRSYSYWRPANAWRQSLQCSDE